MSTDRLSIDVDQAIADAAADSLDEVATFVRSHPRWAQAIIGQSFHLSATAGEWAALAAELDGSDDTTDGSDYQVATRSFGLVDLQAYGPKPTASAPGPCTWTGDNVAEFGMFAERAGSFSWGHAVLDDGHVDRTVIEVWPHHAEPYRPTYARPGDVVAADGTVTRGGAK